MNLSKLIFPIVTLGFIALLSVPILLPEPTVQTIECERLEYVQRGRAQLLVVCPDTTFDSGSAHRHEAFQDTIKTIRHELSN